MQKIKLCHVQVFPILSGVQRAMLGIFQRIDRQKYDITVICKEEGPLTEVLSRQKINIITIPSLDRKINPIEDLRTLVALVNIFFREKFNIVHTHSSKPGFLGRIAAKFSGVPVIIHHVHGFGFHEFSRKHVVYFVSFLERIASWISTRVIFVNDEERKLAIEKGIMSPEKAITIYNGVDLKIFDISKKKSIRNEIRKEFGIPFEHSSHWVIGFVGRLWDQKSPETIIEVANILIKKKGFKNVTFLIVGDGYLEKNMKKKVKQYDINDHIRFLGWRNDNDRVYCAFDVLILPSLWEGMPLTILEAMAFGIPVVANNIKGNREAIIDGETGFLIPPKKPYIFAKSIAKLLKHPEIMKSMGEKARKRAKTLYNSEINTKEIFKLYEKCLKDKGMYLQCK